MRATEDEHVEIQPNIVEEINKIEKTYKFKDYPLIHAIPLMEKKLYDYQDNKKIQQDTRPSSIKKKFKQLDKKLQEAADLLDNDETSLYPYFNTERDFIFDFINNQLVRFRQLVRNENASIEDKGGRPNASLLEATIFYLLLIYSHGTKNAIKCYWSETKGAGVGETFNFLLEMRTILPKINVNLALPICDQTICKMVKKLKNKFNFPTIPFPLASNITSQNWYRNPPLKLDRF